jgi:hypothetical protein
MVCVEHAHVYPPICMPSPVRRQAAGAAPERVIWVATAVRESVTWAQAYWLVALASWY